MAAPAWLPELFPAEPWRRDTYDKLYDVFMRDFVSTQPSYKGSPVWVFPEQEDGKHTIFWHLTSREVNYSGIRYPDIERCKRLPWVKCLIEQAGHRPEIRDWDYEEGDGKVNTYIQLLAFDFMVILRKYRDSQRRLISAYCVDFEHKRLKLQKKYERRL